jgi:hypothetical protein
MPFFAHVAGAHWFARQLAEQQSAPRTQKPVSLQLISAQTPWKQLPEQQSEPVAHARVVALHPISHVGGLIVVLHVSPMQHVWVEHCWPGVLHALWHMPLTQLPPQHSVLLAHVSPWARQHCPIELQVSPLQHDWPTQELPALLQIALQTPL